MFRPLFCVVLLAGLVVARAAEPHPSLPPPVIPDCLGVNIHFTDPQPGELEMLAAAGFKWVRMDFGWEATEKKKGEYDFSAYDRLVAKLDQFKIRAVFILDYGNPLYADPGDVPYFTSRAHTPEFRAAFGKWAVAAVTHFKGRGYLWDMWNEPNGGFWKSPDKTGDYIALAKSTGEALRQAGLLGPKGEAFIGPATSLIDLPYLEACFKAGLLDYWDAVSVHPYRQGAPETVEEEYRSLRLLIRKYAPKDKVIPIISGEWGYSSAWEGLGQDDAARAQQQAKYLPREFLTNIANDVALSIWYDWHEDGTDPKEGEHHFGIVGNEYHPGRDPVYDLKPAYTAMKTLSEQLGGFRFNKRFGCADIETNLLFARNKQTRLVSWERRPGFAMRTYGDKARFDVFTYLDERCPFTPGDEASRNIFGDAPHYLVPLDQDVAQTYQVAAAWERAPLEIIARVPTELTLTSRIENPLPFPLPIRFEAYGPGAAVCGVNSPSPDFTLPAGEAKTLTFSEPLRVPQKGQHVSYLLQFWPQPGFLQGFSQESQLAILNPVDAELLSSSDSAIAIQILNPAGEAVSGVAVYTAGNSEVYSDPSSQPFSLKAGQREGILQFPIPKAKDARGRPLSISDFFGSILTVKFAGSDMSSSFSFRIPVRVKDFSIDHLNVGTDGDAHVRADISVAAGVPNHGAPMVGADGVKIHYKFEAGWRFGQLGFKESPEAIAGLPGWTRNDHREPVGYGVWICGDGKGCQARIRITDSTGQTFQPDGPKIDWKGWRYITFPMQPTDEHPLSHWGGANDGEIHYPIQWDSIFLLDNTSRQPVEGEIYLSGPTLIY